MNDLIEKKIVIENIELNSWGLKIRDEKKLVYNVPKYKKDTEDETVAWKYLNELPNQGMGMTKTLKFVEVPNKNDGTSRYVRIISDDSPLEARPMKETSAPQFDDKESKNGMFRCVAVKAVYPEMKKMSDEAVIEMNKVVEYIKTGKAGMVDVEDIDNVPFV